MKIDICTWALFSMMLVAVDVSGESRAKLLDSGYEGVVVAISQEVDERDGPAIITALKVMHKIL